MKQDHDRDVVEAVEATDMKLFQQRKKSKEEEKMLLQVDAERVQFEANLIVREQRVSFSWVSKIESRKRRNERKERRKRRSLNSHSTSRLYWQSQIRSSRRGNTSL